MFKVVGLKKQEGVFNDKEYSNYLLYVVPLAKDEKVLFGACPQVVKLRKNFVDNNNIDLNSLYQQTIDIYYDAYRNVSKIDVINK